MKIYAQVHVRAEGLAHGATWVNVQHTTYEDEQPAFMARCVGAQTTSRESHLTARAPETDATRCEQVLKRKLKT
jgi:hypothetical protein